MTLLCRMLIPLQCRSVKVRRKAKRFHVTMVTSGRQCSAV